MNGNGNGGGMLLLGAGAEPPARFDALPQIDCHCREERLNGSAQKCLFIIITIIIDI